MALILLGYPAVFQPDVVRCSQVETPGRQVFMVTSQPLPFPRWGRLFSANFSRMFRQVLQNLAFDIKSNSSCNKQQENGGEIQRKCKKIASKNIWDRNKHPKEGGGCLPGGGGALERPHLHACPGVVT